MPGVKDLTSEFINEVRWLQDKREKDPEPSAQQDSLPSTQTDPQLPHSRIRHVLATQTPVPASFDAPGLSFPTSHIDTGTEQFHDSRFIFRNDHKAIIIYGSFYGSYESCVLEAVPEKMHIGPEFIHDQDEACMGGQGHNRMKDLFGNARGARKRPVWIPEMYRSEEAHKWFYILRRASVEEEEFWRRFHEARQKAEEKATAMGIPLRDDLQLMATVSGRLDRSRLYGVTARLPLCCLVPEQRIMRRVETTVYSVCFAFDEHVRRFSEESHLSYNPMPLMMDIVRVAMAAILLTSSSMAAAAGILYTARVSSPIPLPLLLMP
ncbi:hypothetical protein M9H77_18243 [Catharanthus roseus]|uniref:Uncharacterized protein n=1 Tax=Catharanthus roseus TaxID=4058 RepID=A0ACC0B6W7_CATRO|nr:hypothetical protein M9H77_18243 [Catharanthus roseus]